MGKDVVEHDHPPLTANEYLHLVTETWWSDVLLDQFGGNVTDGPFQTSVSRRSIKDIMSLTIPAGTSSTDGIDDVECLGIFLLEGIEFLL